MTEKAEPKPGKSTTEFALSAAVVIIGTIIAAIGAYKNNDVLVGIGSALAGLSQGSYTLGRGKLKAVLAGLATAVKPKTEEEATADGD